MPILRSDTEGLIPEQYLQEIMQGAIADSAALSMFRRLPDMSSNMLSMPVLASLPNAGFVNGEPGHKPVTAAAWEKKTIKAAELAAVVPIPDAVIEDALANGHDLFGQLMPQITQSIGAVIDAAIIFGDGKPADWRESIYDSADAAGAVIASTSDTFLDIFGENGAIAKVENSGYVPDGIISSVPMMGRLRGLRDDNKQPLFMQQTAQPLQQAPGYSLNSIPMMFSRNGAWDTTKAGLLVGDMSQAVFSIRRDISYRLDSSGVITDPVTKVVVNNLMLENMTALIVWMRLGWELPNPVNALQPDGSVRFPFAFYAA